MRHVLLQVLTTLSLHTDKHMALFKAFFVVKRSSVRVKTSEMVRHSDFRKRTKKRKNPTMRITTRDARRPWPLPRWLFAVGSIWLWRVI